MLLWATVFGSFGSTFILAADDIFEQFDKTVSKPLEWFDRTERGLHYAKNISEIEAYATFRNSLFERAQIAHKRKAILEQVRASDKRINDYLEEARREAEKANREANRERFLTFTIQMLNFSSAVANLANSLDTLETESSAADLLASAGEDTEALAKDINDEASDINENLNDLDRIKRVEALIEELSSSDPSDLAELENRQAKIIDAFQTLFNLSDTQADILEKELKITLESAVEDLVPLDPKDWTLRNGFIQGALFFIKPQAPGDGTELGLQHRRLVLERLMQVSRRHLIYGYGIDPWDFERFLVNPKPEENYLDVCLDPPCMRSLD